ncbi:MAG TPA: metallophosphoesterase [Candidatus Acidoferrum sp.]|nr:metallophosphoesterase [Candidatus Acidoferrum sp.]
MNRPVLTSMSPMLRSLTMLLALAFAPAVFSQQVTYAPYIQLGDNGAFGPTDQIVVAWQTNETAPNASAYKVEFGRFDHEHHSATPSARVVDNYLAADPTLPTIPTAYGAHSNYTAVLTGLAYDTVYHYTVTGPGLPAGGFKASFRTRKREPFFSFAVVGDEGYFPVVPNSNPATIVDYEARIAHLIFNAANISVPNEPQRPPTDFIVNTGDNVYNQGAEDNYRDFFFPVYNNDTDSNETGAPLLRGQLFVGVDGNHDLGSTGVTVNLLADNSAPTFSGNNGGGDALGYFNDFYYPQNGPAGVDIQYVWNGDAPTANGVLFTYQGKAYNSPSAIQAFRDSTKVDTGNGVKAQIDHQSNYSFDYGNAHFLFLDANPHVFNDNLPSTNAFNGAPPFFTAYPSPLREWVINDLDSSKQLWKIVVYHQPAFSSGDATIVNNQMRAVAKVLEDHGVNFVFNGHEHNYQRSLPIRATDRTAGPVSATAGTPAVNVDTNFDGVSDTVPDGVLYLVEGGGGNRDFDGNLAPPRGSGVGLDQDDSATGTHTDEPGLTVPQGPASWLDTNLSNPEMVNFVPGAGAGATKITTKFKSKVFSFGHVVVHRNKLTLYQITEPLQDTSSGTSADPAPFGTDINGNPLNDPIPDTEVNPANGTVTSAPAVGASSLLDKWTVTKPNLEHVVHTELSAPDRVQAGQTFNYSVSITNGSRHALNGTQVRLCLPDDVTFAGIAGDTATVQGNEVVVTIGRLAPGAEQTVQIPVQVSSDAERHERLFGVAAIHSATALPIATNSVITRVSH